MTMPRFFSAQGLLEHPQPVASLRRASRARALACHACVQPPFPTLFGLPAIGHDLQIAGKNALSNTEHIGRQQQ